MIKYLNAVVTFSEIPDEISLCINITNCRYNCFNCHSPELQRDIGIYLTRDVLYKLVELNKGITCICFMGYGRNPRDIERRAKWIRKKYPELKIAIYSGDGHIANCWDIANWDYIKVGPYINSLGGLNNPKTNQRLYKINHNGNFIEDITIKFWKQFKQITKDEDTSKETK